MTSPYVPPARVPATYKTLGISPKAVLAFLFPAIVTLGAAAGSWIESGEFDVTETRLAVSGLIASGVSLLGAYLGRPGNVVLERSE